MVIGKFLYTGKSTLLPSNEAALRGSPRWQAGECPTGFAPGGSQGREPSSSVSRFNLGGRGYIRAAFARNHARNLS